VLQRIKKIELHVIQFKLFNKKLTGGKCHNFNLLKKSKLPISSGTQIFIDSGYQGILNFYPNSIQLPHKNTKFHKLSPSQKTANRFISKHRILLRIFLLLLKNLKSFLVNIDLDLNSFLYVLICLLLSLISNLTSSYAGDLIE